jgi:hypothetical protein
MSNKTLMLTYDDSRRDILELDIIYRISFELMKNYDLQEMKLDIL